MHATAALEAHNDIRATAALNSGIHLSHVERVPLLEEIAKRVVRKFEVENAPGAANDAPYCRVSKRLEDELPKNLGMNTFAMVNCECDWNSIVESWAAEIGNGDCVAHKTAVFNPENDGVGCASTAFTTVNDKGGVDSCQMNVCVYDKKPDYSAYSLVSHIKSSCPINGKCCNALPCVNTVATDSGTACVEYEQSAHHIEIQNPTNVLSPKERRSYD